MADNNLGSAFPNQTGGPKSPSTNKLTRALSELTQQAEANSAKVAVVEKFVMNSAEVLGADFLGSLAEGYYGADKLKIGPVDARAAGGLILTLWGVKQELEGDASAKHMLNIGGGLLASFAASAGRATGMAIRYRSSAPSNTVPNSAPNSAPTMQGQYYFPQTNGLLPTPATEGTRQVLPDLDHLPVMMSPETGSDNLPAPSRLRRVERRADRRGDRRDRFQNVPRANAEE